MKKTFIIILIGMLPFCSIAQYGIDGGLVALACGIAWNQEKQVMQHLEERQESLLISNSAIALETTIVAGYQTELYNSLATLDGLVENADIILKIYGSSEKIIEWQDLSFQLLDGNEELLPIYTDVNANILLQMGFLIADIATILTDGENNLMNSSERMLLLNNISERLKVLEAQSRTLYRALEAGLLVYLYDNLDIDALEFDIDHADILQRSIDNYDEIFNN